MNRRCAGDVFLQNFSWFYIFQIHHFWHPFFIFFVRLRAIDTSRHGSHFKFNSVLMCDDVFVSAHIGKLNKIMKMFCANSCRQVMRMELVRGVTLCSIELSAIDHVRRPHLRPKENCILITSELCGVSTTFVILPAATLTPFSFLYTFFTVLDNSLLMPLYQSISRIYLLKFTRTMTSIQVIH